MIIKDLNGNTEMLIGYKDMTRKGKVNGERSLSFMIIKDPKNEHVYPMTSEESLIDYDGQAFRIKRVIEKSRGNRSIKNVEAEHKFLGDLLDNHQYETIDGSTTIQTAMTHALAGSGYSFTVVGSFKNVTLDNFGDDNSLALVQTILEKYGAEMNPNGMELALYNQVGVETDFQFRYKYNLKAIEKEVDTKDLSTYIKGFGKDGLTVEYESPMAQIYGRRHAKPVRDDRFTIADSLLDHIKTQIQDEPKISFTIDYAQLKNGGYEGETIGLGDTVFVIYEPLGIDITARVMEMTDYPESNKMPQITLANFNENASDIISNFTKTQKTVDRITTDGSLNNTALSGTAQQAIDAVNRTTNQIQYTTDGFRGVDPADSKRWVGHNNKGIVATIDNGTTVKYMITPDGVNLVNSYGSVKEEQVKIGPGTTFATGYDPSKMATSGHNHDDRYYKQDEMDAKLADMDVLTWMGV
jgi:phage minor structural protein